MRSVAVLLALVIIVALLVVDMRHRSRLLFAELQTLQQKRDALNVEWGKLLLEEATWSQHRRIEALAQAPLGMESPHPSQIVVVHVPGSGNR